MSLHLLCVCQIHVGILDPHAALSCRSCCLFTVTLTTATDCSVSCIRPDSLSPFYILHSYSPSLSAVCVFLVAMSVVYVSIVLCTELVPLYLHLATSEMWCRSGGRVILKKKTVYELKYCVLLQWCTKVWSVLTGRSTVLGFDLAWFSSDFWAPLCLRSSWCCIYILKIFLLTSFSLPFNELSLVGLVLDVVD